MENESLRSAVYVNVAQLRQSISESPPSAPSSYSPSYLDPEGWEVHVDQESGQDYYYHPSTGQTTWDNPFLESPTDPERPPAEDPCSPSPPQSPALSLSTSSPPAWTSDWEQLVDETSGRPYFYNAMSGGDVLGAPGAAEPLPAADGADERAQVSRGGAGKDGRAAPLSLSLAPVLASPRGKLQILSAFNQIKSPAPTSQTELTFIRIANSSRAECPQYYFERTEISVLILK